MDGWIHGRWQIHTMEYYLALKRKENLTQDTIWMSLEDTTLREINPTQKAKYYVAYHYWRYTEESAHGDREQKGGCRARGGEIRS